MLFTIIGCGKMGTWFAGRLRSTGHSLLLHDAVRPRAVRLARKVGGEVLGSISESPEEAPALIALPVSATGPVIADLARGAERRLRILEVSAFKRPLSRYVRYARMRGHLVASIHPLFGPGQPDDSGTVTVHVDRASRGEDRLVRLVLPRTRLVRMSVEEHDRSMLLALSLTHFIGVSAGLALHRHMAGMVETKSMSALLSLVAIALNESRGFYEDYPMRSPEALRVFRSYSRIVSGLVGRLSREGEWSEVEAVMQGLVERLGLRDLYRSLYRRRVGVAGKASYSRAGRH
jgi:prephenate dehydrogenase